MEKGASRAGGRGELARPRGRAWKEEVEVWGMGAPMVGPRCFDNIIALLLRAQ